MPNRVYHSVFGHGVQGPPSLNLGELKAHGPGLLPAGEALAQVLIVQRQRPRAA